MPEQIPATEAADTQTLVELALQMMEPHNCPVRRDQHPKHHGAVRAEFIVESGLPADLARGVFASPRSFGAWIRFSNGLQLDDRKPDAHGMAIKIMDVPGPKLLDDERDAGTQDFVSFDNAAFFAKDVLSMRKLAQVIMNSRKPSLLKRLFFFASEETRIGLYIAVRHFLLGFRFRELKQLRSATGKTISDPLAQTYWSVVPSRVGDVAVKFKITPSSPAPVPFASPSSPDRLRLAMRQRLAAGEARFDFFVIRPINDAVSPIEDPSIEWPETDLVKVAQIIIPKQDFESAAQMAFCENLSFTPWHSLPEHEPIGGINRCRKPVYQAVSMRRHELNGVKRIEPTPESSAPETMQRGGFDLLPLSVLPMTKPEPKNTMRSTDGDGFKNRLERYVLTHFGPLWRLAQRIPPVQRRVNSYLINSAVSKCPPRPNPLSMMHNDYTSWDSLTNREYSGRHLYPCTDEFFNRLPKVDDVLKLFERAPGSFQRSNKSTVLFLHFAQWFTDGFLRTARLPDDSAPDYQRNTTNHEIDLSPLYGRTREVARALRRLDGSGKLRSQIIHPSPGNSSVGGEFPSFYFNDEFVKGGLAGDPSADPEYKLLIRPGFEHIANELRLLKAEKFFLKTDPGRMRSRFAMGVERANNQIGYVMMNTLFLREHNRLCDLLKTKHPDWDDDRLYHTARNTVIVMVIKLVIEEYINHISPFHFQFRAQPERIYRYPWYRTNWITLEFNLLYRWHSMVPDQLKVGSKCVPLEEAVLNNQLVIDTGLAAIVDSASRQAAGRVGLFNTPPYLIGQAERPSLQLSRDARLKGYNDYREHVGYKRVTRFDQISGDVRIQQELERLYGHPDNLEFFVGLFAEDVAPGSALPPVIGRMVAIDAFSQALTNPLLSGRVFRRETFAEGWDELNNTNSLGDIVRRNTPEQTIPNLLVTMTQK